MKKEKKAIPNEREEISLTFRGLNSPQNWYLLFG